jgi:hypothetical protein
MAEIGDVLGEGFRLGTTEPFGGELGRYRPYRVPGNSYEILQIKGEGDAAVVAGRAIVSTRNYDSPRSQGVFRRTVVNAAVPGYDFHITGTIRPPFVESDPRIADTLTQFASAALETAARLRLVVDGKSES